ncbi:NAD(P)-binding protein [Daldinia grandis]|nr:NAD(P)-binding protein [Daldinia grandis]
MAAIAETVVATGATSGLGFELVKQLLEQTQPYKFILGARDTKTAQAAFDGLKYDNNKHSLTILPLELSNLKTVKTFSQQALDKVGQDKIDYLMLNAAINKNSKQPGPHGSKWSEPYIVNHLSQHYLIHLLREKLEASKSRIVVISSGAACFVKDPTLLEDDLKGGSKTKRSVYGATKFVQLLGAHWWRRQLEGKCHVVAVSPGLVPSTNLVRGSNQYNDLVNRPEARSVSQGARSIYRAFTRDDFPEDPDEIFLASWGDWWPKDIYGLTLDKDLQDKWSPSKDEIEKEEGLSA